MLMGKFSLHRRIEQSRPRLYRMAFAWCCDRALAEDLTQECLARALQKCRQLREEEKLECWLYRILNNCWYEYLRREKPTTLLDEEDYVCVDCPEQLAYQEEVVDQVRRAVAQLATSQRKVITLVDLEEFSYAEVARILDIPIGTVMSRLSRARSQLQRLLEGSFPTAQSGTVWRVK